MQVRHTLAALAAGALFTVIPGASAQAQTLGTFSWQLQPYCNKVVVTVIQNGGLYNIDGYDDQCGAAQRAPLVGLATPNPDGSIGFGLNIVTVPGGRNVHVDARIDIASLSGPWSDSAGNTGTFVLGGAAAGSPRPAPTVPGSVLTVGSIPGTAIANGAIGNAQIANNVVSSLQTSNEPGVSSSYVNTPSVVVTSLATVTSTSMRVPADGYVKIEVTGNMFQSDTSQASCQLQKGSQVAVDLTEPFFWLRNDADGIGRSFSAHRIVPVSRSDNPLLLQSGQVFRMVCSSTGTQNFRSIHLSATYYASSYEPLLIIFPFDPATSTTPPTPQPQQ